MLTVIKVGLLVGLFLVTIIMTIISVTGENSLEPFIYWLVLLSAIWLIWVFHLNSKLSLWTALSLLILSALFTSVGLGEVGETVMRLSLLGWIIGLVQRLLEYKIQS